jgi:L-threonylcarbamoyladenylate synthase
VETSDEPGTDDPRLIRIPDDEEQWDTLLEVGTKVLESGQLAVLPTDTVYGVACNPFDPTAVDRLFAAKARGRDLPLPVLVHNWRQAIGLVEEVDERARALIAAYWPGPLTLIFREAPGIGWDLGDSRGTVGVRMPKHTFTQALIRRAGPLAVTSANRSGQPPGATVPEIMAQLDEGVGVYFDGGPAGEAPASTIVDLTGQRARVLRQGSIPPAEIERVIDEPLAAADGDGEEAGISPPGPGA